MTLPFDTSVLTPQETVAKLDQYIIGQDRAKKIVAIALRNRHRRMKLPQEIRDDIAPKNIIMVGPTGVGKTEIARRMALLVNAPFVKVEATKYTEVGYVGRDVESMIRDLMANSMSLIREHYKKNIEKEIKKNVEMRIVDLLLPADAAHVHADSKKTMLDDLRRGKLDDKTVEIQVPKSHKPKIEFANSQSFDDVVIDIGGLGNMFGGGNTTKKVAIKDARQILFEQEFELLVDENQIVELAKRHTEENGVIFIDEIDKIVSKDSGAGGGTAAVSREGVQRDILPIIEGSSVKTRYGLINTQNILFIAAGAFHTSKPSDLIPELQGRFPLRVELTSLSKQDFEAILKKPKNALIFQYCKLLETENVTIKFSADAIKEVARIATEVNHKTDNIGARRLYTILELLLEDISFSASELAGQTIPITKQYVHERLSTYTDSEDMTKYIL